MPSGNCTTNFPPHAESGNNGAAPKINHLQQPIPSKTKLSYFNSAEVGLSYTHLGRGHTEYIPRERLKEVKRQIANYRKFRDLTQEWVDLAVELCKLKQAQADKA